MSDMDKNHQSSSQEEAPKSTQEHHQPSTWKRLLAKKWVFPATYMIAAAIILSLVWALQGNFTQPLANDDLGLQVSDGITDANGNLFPDSDAAPVNGPVEKMQWPVRDTSEVIMLMPFYDEAASAEEKAAALIQQDNEFMPHRGVSIGLETDDAFDVVAALSGTVTRVVKLPMVGHQVEISHENGWVTVYQSLAPNIMVSEQDQVEQGQVIGQAGRNELERDLGVHLHFEVRENDRAVNPQSYLPALASEQVSGEAATIEEASVDADADTADAADADSEDAAGEQTEGAETLETAVE